MNENIAPELSASQENVQLEPSKDIQSVNEQIVTKEEIVSKLKGLLEVATLSSRAEVDSLKQSFYKLKAVELNLQKEKYAEANEANLDGFVAEFDPIEEEIKTVLTAIKDKRAKVLAEEEKQMADNLKKKLAIIEEIKKLTESSDDFSHLYKEFKDLQQKWNDIKHVPQGEIKDLWRSYQIYTEKFYDLMKINNELRDYDFKKNLELKLAICDSAEKLDQESDVVSAFHQLQNFHQQWRDVGPVDKDLRDEIWERFKKASTDVNKKYQDHFVELKSVEETNLTEKTAICETLKNIDFSLLQSAKIWDEKTKEVIALQDKWKKIGFVPRKVNTQIFEEYRALCDSFFDKKAEFFKEQRGDMDINLEKKKQLCEKANALKESTDWKKTTDELIALQKEWKTIGPVPRKFSDQIWKEFVAACDLFFEERNKSRSSQNEDEATNLNAKKELIEKIKGLDQALDSKAFMDILRACMNEWNAIGFVPFKEKDKVYKEYQLALDAHFDRLKVNKNERRFESFKSNVDDISRSDNPKHKLIKERERLIFQYNKVKSDVQTYENNMGFLSISKGGDGLLKEMNRRISDLKGELDVIAEKIATIDASLASIG